MSDRVLAVIDVGSNSGRIVVLRIPATGHLEILVDSRAPLRLGRDVQRSGRIAETTMARAVAVLQDFQLIAASARASETVAVATSAVRDASNGGEFIDRIRADSGMSVRVIEGDAEARYALRGAVHGLWTSSGLLMDIGGGSLEVASFAGRGLTGSWTLPLGALRTSDEFLRSDPPPPAELERLRGRVREMLAAAGVTTLGSGDHLVATGGTVRNLAKIDRRARAYPIPRLHGYVIEAEHLGQIVDRLAARSAARRAQVPGLNPDRADSIVGGAVVAAGVAQHVGALRLLVSGQGLREGLALDAAGRETLSVRPARQASVGALAARFSAWDRARAVRRTAIATRLREAVWPAAGDDIAERLAYAATLLDLGRSIDYYRRHQHAADVVVESDLAGFSHRELALLAAVIRAAHDQAVRWQAYRPLLTKADREPVGRSGVILGLADATEQRMPAGAVLPIACQHGRGFAALDLPILDPWLRDSLARRFARAFGMRLELRPLANASSHVG